MNKKNFSKTSLVNKLESIVFVVDSSTKKIVFSNDYTKKIFEEFVEGKCFQLISGDKNIIKCPFRDEIGKCDDNQINTCLVKENFNQFNYRYYEIRSQQMKLDNGDNGMSVMMIDITDRKQHEEALKYNENLFRSIFESFVDIYFQATVSGSVTLISPSCENLSGYKPEELQHVNLASIIIDDNSSIDLLAEIRSQHQLRDRDLILIRKDCKRVPVSFDCRLIFDTNNEPLHIEGTIRDNSKRLLAEAKLKEAAEQAIENQRMRNEFIANMNHELRTPLNGILGYTQILKSEEGLNDNQISGIDVIERSAQHLLGIINDILDLSKIEAGKMELQYATFNFPDLIKTIYEMILVRAREKRIGVILNRKTELPSITISDKKRLGQVLLNLLTNAVKFTDFGTVTLNVGYEKGRVHFEVVDTGFGIPKDQIENIFIPFNQLSEHTQKSQGTGLGLSLSKKIVNKMGGDITVDSELGKGSSFKFDIPMKLADESILTPNKPSKIVGYDGETKTILVVDDEKNDRKLLKALLHPKGFNLVEATDGIDVLKIVEKDIPDLILLDLLMPQLNGYELTKELRSLERTKNIPIVIVTAFDPKDVKNQFKGMDVREFILKPIDEAVLLNVIQELLSLSWNYLDNRFYEITDVQKAKLVYPDIDRLIELNELVMRRNFSKLYENLLSIEAENESFKPFVRKIKKLADSFNSILISNELTKIIEEANVPIGQ